MICCCLLSLQWPTVHSRSCKEVVVVPIFHFPVKVVVSILHVDHSYSRRYVLLTILFLGGGIEYGIFVSKKSPT
jgi:hypothetical protein